MECKDLDMIKQAKAARRSVRGAKGSGEVRLTIQTSAPAPPSFFFLPLEPRCAQRGRVAVPWLLLAWRTRRNQRRPFKPGSLLNSNLR